MIRSIINLKERVLLFLNRNKIENMKDINNSDNIKVIEPIAQISASPNNFNTVANRVIKNSIRSAICIDDNYLAPYADKDARYNEEDPKKLYHSFRKDGNCDLDIYQFETIEKWDEHDYMTHNKDLMVLDWELDQTGTKYESTLKILNKIIPTKRIPFIVIYTHTEDLNSVSKVLCQNYNHFCENDYSDLINSLKEKLKNLSDEAEDIEHFLEGEEELFYTFFKFYSKRDDTLKDLIKKLSSFLKYADVRKLENKVHSIFKEKFNTKTPLESLLFMSQIILSNKIKHGSYRTKNVRIEIEKDCFLINGVIVLVIHKKNDSDGVNPEDLFSVFSEVLSSNPHSIINLLGLELKDKLREDFSMIGTKFNMINKKAFLYHANNYKIKNGNDSIFDKISFQNFVIQSWMNELTQYNLDLELESTNLLEDLLEEIDIDDDLQEKLVQYASMVSCVNLDKRKSKKLIFGDIFKSESKYFLCITPLCDCLNPSKINNQFYFVTGEKVNNKTSLEEAEKGYYSFLKNDDNYIAIEWKCKPFTSYISDDKNNIENISLSYMGENKNLIHCTILKENYTQRIANQSFGYGYRVGVDFPHLKS